MTTATQEPGLSALPATMQALRRAERRVKPPLTIGHEFMGHVAAAGVAVRSVVVGDRVSPGNRLQALRGARVGQHSIRINDQYRVSFRWTDTGVVDVQIVDYH